MEKIKNLSREDIKDIIKDFPIEPLYNKLIITVNTVENQSEVVTSNTEFSEIQYVVARGTSNHESIIKGCKVILDIERLSVRVPSKMDQTKLQTQIKIDPIEVDGVIYGIIDDRCVKAIDKRK